ncbi:hypothetical protein R6Q59_033495 [Mikania micrantha]
MDPNNPFFNPFMNFYRPQVIPNNPNNPNQFLTFSNWYPQQPFLTKTHPPLTTFMRINRNPMLMWFQKHNPTRNRLHRVAGTDERKCQKKKTKPSITRWSEVEEVALARAYIDVSEDPFVGNNQTSTEF